MATVNLGRVKQQWKGTYNAGTAYTVDDLVQYTDGTVLNTYISTAASTGNAPSTNGTIHASWAFQAKSGGGLFDDSLAIGTAGQVLMVNSGATALEWGTVSAGNNFLYKTADYTILEADFEGKPELVVGIDAASANKTITLPALSTTSLTHAIITILCTANAGTDYEVRVNQDAGDNSGAELWSGTQHNDFVRLCKVGSAWHVLDHRETYFTRRYMVSDQYIDGYNHEHLTSGGWNVYVNATNGGTIDGNDWGNCWNSGNNEYIVPFDSWTDMNLSGSFPGEANDNGLTTSWKVNGTTVYRHYGRHSDGRICGPDGTCRIYMPTMATWNIQPWCQMMDDNGSPTHGGRSGEVCQLHIQSTRRWS